MDTIESVRQIFVEMEADRSELRAQLSSVRILYRDERITSENLRTELLMMHEDMGQLEEKYEDVREELHVERREREYLKAKVKRVRGDALNSRAEIFAAHQEQLSSLKNELSRMEKEIEVSEPTWTVWYMFIHSIGSGTSVLSIHLSDRLKVLVQPTFFFSLCRSKLWLILLLQNAEFNKTTYLFFSVCISRLLMSSWTSSRRCLGSGWPSLLEKSPPTTGKSPSWRMHWVRKRRKSNKFNKADEFAAAGWNLFKQFLLRVI